MAPIPDDERGIHPPTERKTLEWITALASADVPYRLRREADGWRLTVPDARHDEALAVIREYETVNRGWPPRKAVVPAGPARAHPLWSGLWGSGFIVMVFASFGAYDSARPWLRAAAADAGAITGGDWWRVITALTLHADFPHLAGNAVMLTVLGGWLCRTFGVGLAWFLVLASGILGNLVTALLSEPSHLAVGSSTAAFGALGLLATDQAIEAYRHTGHWRSVWSRVWVPLSAGLAMLGLLGVAPGSDIAAHGWGFFAGIGLAPLGRLPRIRGLGETGQAALAVTSVAILMLAWRAAIRAAG